MLPRFPLRPQERKTFFFFPCGLERYFLILASSRDHLFVAYFFLMFQPQIPEEIFSCPQGGQRACPFLFRFDFSWRDRLSLLTKNLRPPAARGVIRRYSLFPGRDCRGKPLPFFQIVLFSVTLLIFSLLSFRARGAVFSAIETPQRWGDREEDPFFLGQFLSPRSPLSPPPRVGFFTFLPPLL